MQCNASQWISGNPGRMELVLGIVSVNVQYVNPCPVAASIEAVQLSRERHGTIINCQFPKREESNRVTQQHASTSRDNTSLTGDKSCPISWKFDMTHAKHVTQKVYRQTSSKHDSDALKVRVFCDRTYEQYSMHDTPNIIQLTKGLWARLGIKLCSTVKALLSCRGQLPN